MARRIAALIAAEDPAAPLTDEQLSAHLSQDGIPVSRRTITNWRNRTGHPAAAQRKRRP